MPAPYLFRLVKEQGGWKLKGGQGDSKIRVTPRSKGHLRGHT